MLMTRKIVWLVSYLTKAKGPCLPYYLPIAEERINGFMPFSRALVQSEMQPHPEFELGSLVPFPMMTKTTLNMLLSLCKLLNISMNQTFKENEEWKLYGKSWAIAFGRPLKQL